MKRVFYLAIFHEVNNEYWVSFPDFPECFSQGSTLEDSFKHAQEALELCIEERLRNKEKLPNPTLFSKESDADKHILLSCEYDVNAIAA